MEKDNIKKTKLYLTEPDTSGLLYNWRNAISQQVVSLASVNWICVRPIHVESPPLPRRAQPGTQLAAQLRRRGAAQAASMAAPGARPEGRQALRLSAGTAVPGAPLCFLSLFCRSKTRLLFVLCSFICKFMNNLMIFMNNLTYISLVSKIYRKKL